MLIATISSMIAYWITALFLLYQTRHMRTDRNVEVTMRMFEWSESNRMRDALRWVTTKFDLATHLKQPEEERSEYPGIVIAFFEQAGIMIEKRLVNEDVVIDHLSVTAIRAWRSLEPLIRHQREHLGDDRLGEHFEFLYRRAEAYESNYRRRGARHSQGAQ
jgi:hypothetical protein